MSLLNLDLNKPENWEAVRRKNKRRIEVDLDEVERVMEIARRTPGLFPHESCFKQLSIFFATSTRYYRDHDPDGLEQLVAFWERYRSAVIQRFAAVTPVELRAADKVVTNVFDRFILKVPTDRIAYHPEARPLVYGGEGGLYGYFTHPPGWNRPFAIINLPHAAFDNVWHWLALPHETGHDLYATVEGLEEELAEVLGDRMARAVRDGEVDIPDVEVDLSLYDLDPIKYSGEEFLVKVWKGWANEAQADLVGVLNCGGAAIATLQQIIGFRTADSWMLMPDDFGGVVDGPEPHPTSYVRNALNIHFLRTIDGGSHGALADEIEKRFRALRPDDEEIVWRIAASIEVARVPVEEMVKSAAIAAEVLCRHPLDALGRKSYPELGTFTAHDQELVEQMVTPLLEADSTFTQVSEDAEARHALAATLFAFEKDSEKAGVVNKTFQHFV